MGEEIYWNNPRARQYSVDLNLDSFSSQRSHPFDKLDHVIEILYLWAQFLNFIILQLTTLTPTDTWPKVILSSAIYNLQYR
jgi:hypothetical protein